MNSSRARLAELYDTLNKAAALHRAGDIDQARRLYKKVQKGFPGEPNSLRFLAIIDLQEDRPEQAWKSLLKVVEVEPTNPDNHYYLGRALMALHRWDKAISSFEACLSLNGKHVNAIISLGLCHQAQRRLTTALGLFEIAGKAGGQSLDLLRGRIRIMKSHFKDRLDEVLDLLRTGQSQFPGDPVLRIEQNDVLASICDWSKYDDVIPALTNTFSEPDYLPNFLAAIAAGVDGVGMKTLTGKFAASITHSQSRATPPIPAPHDRIRICYLSADLGSHPVGQLMKDVIRHHDKKQFEISFISPQPSVPTDPIEREIVGNVNNAIFADDKSTEAFSNLIRNIQPDILVDLMGYTSHMRIDVLAQRPAPVTIEYLGYPGTTGVHFIDYIIADSHVCPPGAEQEFSEHVLRLPNCFFPANNETAISSVIPSRTQAGLPEKGIVFCAFNQAFKITPEIFEVWMRILAAVEGSVLWLSVGGKARINLRREAEARGIDPARLVFAERVDAHADHLARHALADLFLDTPFYNAHTTAADALWAGLPVVTVTGPSFAGRVASSMLRTLGLSELIASTLADYERLVLDLATDEGKRTMLRNRLATARSTSPLFDVATYTCHLEEAYLYAHGRSKAGLPPRPYDIPATV